MIINVYKDKYYVCRNALLCPINSDEDHRIFEKFINDQRTSNLLLSFPKTIYSQKFLVEGKVVLSQYVVIKCSIKPIDIPKGFIFYEKLRIGPSLYGRLSTTSDKILMLYNKIGVYAFENDIPLKDETISVYLKESDTEIEMDAFVPIDVK